MITKYGAEKNKLALTQPPSGREGDHGSGGRRARNFSLVLVSPLFTYQILYNGINIFTNSNEIIINLAIRKANNLKSVSFKNIRAECIILFADGSMMLRAVDFYYKLRLVTEEIRDKIINGLLSLKPRNIF